MIQNKWLATFAVILAMVGVERIVEWYVNGYARHQSPSLPEATGTHALVTGIAIVVLGVWVAFASTRGKSTSARPSPAPETTSKLDR
jgi:hypothetical protein